MRPVCRAGPEGPVSNVYLRGNRGLTPCSVYSSSNKENIWVCEVAAIERTLQKNFVFTQYRRISRDFIVS